VLAPSFKNLAKAHIITAEFDLERDEGEYYGRLMREAGNEVTMKRYPGVPIVLDSGFKWSQLASLIACAHTLGLHLDPKSWRLPPWQIAQRRCLSYFIYSTDKWLALSLGRPPLLHYDNWLVTSPSQEDRPVSGLDPQAWTNIMKRAKLDSLLDRVLTQL
jgi:hypothetical protein